MIIAITGTPCTGKTAVAKILADSLRWKLIELNSLAQEQGLFCGYDKGRKARIVDVEKVKRAVLEIPRKENLVIESHYSHDIPNDLTIVLRCEIRELKKRMQDKGFSKEKIQENLQAEIFGICLEEALELKRRVVEVDTTGKTPENIAEFIQKKVGKRIKG